MTPYTHNHQQPAWAAEVFPRHTPEDATPADANGVSGMNASHPAEQAGRSVMHPDHHDPDWRYYFGAMAG